MYGVNDLNISALGDPANSMADPLEWRPEAFTAMGRYDNESLGRVEYLPLRRCEYAATQHSVYSSNRVGNGISGDVDGVFGNAFLAEIVRCPLGGGKVQRCQTSRENSIRL